MSPGGPKRVLLYRLGSLGDHLVAVPAYRMVRRAFPAAELRLLTNVPVAAKAAAAEAVLAGSGLVDSFEGYPVGLRNPLRLMQLVWRIRRWKPEALVYLAGVRGIAATRRDSLFFRACGIRRQIGLPLTEDLQRNRPQGVDDTGTPWAEPEADRLCRNLADLGTMHTDNPAEWELNLTAAERADAAALLAPLGGTPFFAFSIGTKAQVNHWGEANWSEFFRSLAPGHPAIALVLLGAADEAAVSERIGEAWRRTPGAGPVLNLCGAATPRVSAAILERTRMFFGHDSGPAHLAASTGVPLFHVRSARTPAGQWFPHGKDAFALMHWMDCGGCQLDTCITQGKKCLVSITVPEALTAARAHLAQTLR